MTPTSFTSKSNILNLFKGERLKTPPIWFMRQAGRYLSEYREIRKTFPNFMDMCFHPESVCKVTLQPIDRFDFDAAIIFSDILVIPFAMGYQVEFSKSYGPKITPIFNGDINITKQGCDSLKASYEAIKLTRLTLAADKALIGFSGAPWTLMTYLCGGKSGDVSKALDIYQKHPENFMKMMNEITDRVIQHLLFQIKAGVDLVQIFDSWAGGIPHDLFEKLCIEPILRIVLGVKAHYPNIPIIGFPKGIGCLYPKFVKETGVDGISIDHFVDIKTISDEIEDHIVIQGNLSPDILLQGGDILEKSVKDICDKMKNRRFIFNLGHGIIKETPVENVYKTLKYIRE